jgi:hypothetical protein
LKPCKIQLVQALSDKAKVQMRAFCEDFHHQVEDKKTPDKYLAIIEEDTLYLNGYDNKM